MFDHLPLTDAAINFAGVFLGAFLAYRVTVYYGNRETEAKRVVLLSLLADELRLIDGTMSPSYPSGKVFHRPPVQVTVLPQLLDGNTLTYASHGSLIPILIKLNERVGRLNKQMEVTTSFQMLGQGTDDTHRWQYDQIRRILDEVVELRDAALSLIPSDSIRPNPPTFF